MELAIKEITGVTAGQSADTRVGGKKTVEERHAISKDEPEEASNKEMPQQELEKIASEIQIQLKRINTELRFEVDSASREIVVKILDPDSQQVIRQIPSEELLAIRARMDEIIGVLYNAHS